MNFWKSGFRLKINIKKILIIFFVLFILFLIAAVSLPTLSATRDDAHLSSVEKYYDEESETEVVTAQTDYKIDSSLFEIKNYEIKYKTNETLYLQNKIKELKKKNFVIFDRYDESKQNSQYVIKVKRENFEEVLEFLKELSPVKIHLFVENIKKSIDSTIDREKLLSDKLRKIEVILNDAIESYSSLLKLAKEQNNIESLTKLIDLKINTLNKLSNEKNAILEQINYIKKNRKELFDKVNFVIFRISIEEFLYLDIIELKNSWQYEVKNLVSTLNNLAQNLSVKFLIFVVNVIKFMVYFIFVLLLLKILFWTIKKIFNLEQYSFLEKDE